MADSSVLLEVIVEGKGVKVVQRQLDQVASSTNKASKATDNLTKSRNTYHKGEKGVASAGANSTKNFSKMRGVIDGGGSSGLVAAYATLAANLFAATAAFNALRSASKVDELAAGLELIGVKSGRDLGRVAESLREITGAAVSTEQALRTAAVATSAGFNDTQLTDLAKVAKGASIALGRDLGDALDRLVRGTAKLEPEILDELGIFVRIDDAANEYATALGKTAEELTEFERRQAFLNQATQKGLEKFEEIADALDTNPYDKLGAAFSNLAKEVVSAINKKLIPVISYFTRNLSALGGITLLAGTSVAKNLAGSFVNFTASAAESAVALGEQNKVLLQNLEVTDKLPAKYLSLNEKFKDGTASLDDYKTGIRSLGDSIDTHENQLKRIEAGTMKYKGTLEDKKTTVNAVRQTQANLRQELVTSTTATSQLTKAQALQNIQNFQLITGIKGLYSSVVNYTKGVWTAVAGTNALSLSIGILKIVSFGAGAIVAGLVTAALTLLPVIAAIIAFGPQLYEWAREKFFPEDIIKEREEQLVSSLDIIDKTLKDFSDNFDVAGKDAAGTSARISNIIKEISERVKEAAELDKEAGEERAKALEPYLKKQKEIKKELEKAKKENDKPEEARQNVLLARVEEKIKAINDAEKDLALTRKNGIRVLDEALTPFYEAKVDPVLKQLIPDNTFEKLGELERAFADGNIGPKQLIEGILNLTKPFDTATAAFGALITTTNEWKEAQNELAAKKSTPFDKLIEGAEKAKDEITTIKNNATDLSEVLQEGSVDNAILASLQKVGLQTENQLNKHIEKLKEGRRLYIEYPGIIKKQESIVRGLQKIAKEDVLILKQYQAEQRELNRLKLAELDNEESLIREAAAGSKLSEKDNARLLEIVRERGVVEEAILKTKTDAEELAVAEVEHQRKLFDLSSKVLANRKQTLAAQQELEKIEYQLQKLAAGGTEEMSAAEELALFLKQKDARAKLMLEEFNLKIAGINLEYDLLEAKFELLIAEAKFRGVEISNQGKIRDLLTEGRKSSIEAATAEYNLSVKRLELEEALLRKKAQQAQPGFAGSTGEFLQEVTNSTAQAQATVEVAQRDKEEADKRYSEAQTAAYLGGMAPGAGGKTFEELQEELANARQAADDAAIGVKQSFIMATLQGVQPMLDKLRELGPEGELVATITESTGVMAMAFLELGKAGTSAADKMAAVGAIVSSIGNIMAASSKAKIAGIDKEIEAEKKRDGKSKESLAKIQALEKKKEKAERKQFENNKKIKMAETIINTAAAIMKAAPNIPMMALFAALGAAQLAIIAGTSYQGGSSAGGGSSVPSEVSVGERSNKVDVSQKATGNELAGLRGGETIRMGGMPGSAFMGARYRAEGGPTAGYIVGEQGPELFVPETPGRIVPNDEMRQSQPLNVNFTVQAIDASSFNDALTTQRGNIISMIREAANTYGETFLENVNDTAINAGGGKI